MCHADFGVELKTQNILIYNIIINVFCEKNASLRSV